MMILSFVYSRIYEMNAWKLFSTFFKIGTFTFGGGYVIVPLMKKRFVEEYQWIEEKEMLDMIAIAQSSPGAIAVNTSVIVGYRMGGVLGALVTVLGTVTPPLIILSLISLAYEMVIDNRMVQCVLKGMQIGVAAVVMDVVITMVGQILKEKKAISVLILIAAFVVAFFTKINIAFIILGSGIIGILELFWSKNKKQAGEVK